MADAAHKTPSPGFDISDTDHTYGKSTSLVGADEALAPKAR